MFDWFKRRAGYRDASTGSVNCPQHGTDVELDSCFGCGRLIDLKRGEGGEVQVRCEKSASPGGSPAR